MHPFPGRRFATRRFTSHILAAAIVAGGTGLVPPGLADAASPGLPDHGHRRGHAATDSAPGAGRNDGAGARGAGHAGHAPSKADTPAVAEYKAAHAGMMRGMDVPYTGDPDVDFRVQMIPHHQGAIDMAKVALRRAEDPWTRQLAEAVIVEQQREIAEMRAWLARRGIEANARGEPQHIITASSYRRRDPESGSRDEAAVSSWSPGSGAPAQR